jgi:hypothetical protein
VAIAVWHAILESAACTNDGGAYETTPRRVAAVLGEPIAAVEAVFAEMQSLGMICDGSVSAWSKRQFLSDTSTERSRKHREAKRNADATLQQQDATPPYTETETYTDTISNEIVTRKRDKTSRKAKAEADDKVATATLEPVLGADLAAKVVQHRRDKKSPLSANAAEMLAKRFAESSNPQLGAEAMIANGWQGFDPSWMERHSNGRGQSPPARTNFIEAGKRIIEDMNRDTDTQGHSGYLGHAERLP